MYMFIRFYFSLLRLSVKRATLMLFHHAMTYLEIANCQMSQRNLFMKVWANQNNICKKCLFVCKFIFPFFYYKNQNFFAISFKMISSSKTF